MINTNYGNLYGQYMSTANNGRTKGRVGDKANRSENTAYPAKAKAATEKAAKAAQPEKQAVQVKGAGTKDITQEDLQKLYAQWNGIRYGEYDEKDSYRSMANTFLNEMVFSPMSSSKDLFVPQMSRSVLSAAFNVAYDAEGEIRRIKENYEAETLDAAEEGSEAQA